MSTASDDEALGARIARKVQVRLTLPLVFLMFLSSLDRSNVSFAALQMNADLGLSATAYGFGAGILFIGYVLAKYPSVLLYEAFGMRRWLAAIAIGWGVGAVVLLILAAAASGVTAWLRRGPAAA